MVRDGGMVSKDDNVSVASLESAAAPAAAPALVVVVVGLLPLLDATGDRPNVACSQSSISDNVGDVAVVLEDAVVGR